MSNPPSSPSSPPDVRFRALKHSKTFTSLSDSIRSLRDSQSGSPEPPTTPRSKLMPTFLHGQSALETANENSAVPVLDSPRTAHNPPAPGLPSRPRHNAHPGKSNHHTVRDPVSPQSPRHSSPQLDNAATGSPRSPPFLQKRAISSPSPSSAFPTLSLPLSPALPETVTPASPPFSGPLNSSPISLPLGSERPTHAINGRPFTPLLDTTKALNIEPASIIAASGSTNAAIVQLVKDKQAALGRSEQLWRLVEKQRTMIVGLSRDLEAALQDKEKYRKKVKELLALTPDGLDDSVSTQVSGLINDQEASRSSSREIHNISTITAAPLSSGMIELPMTPNTPDTPEKVIAQSNVPLSESHMGSLMQAIPTASRSVPPVSHGLAGNLGFPAKDSSKPTELRLMPSPMEKSRKPPPKPLNLSQKQRIEIPGDDEKLFQDSASDYSDLEETPPLPERGRRKTRDDDDRKRDITGMNDEGNTRQEKTIQTMGRAESLPSQTPITSIPPLVMRMPSYRGVDAPTAVSANSTMASIGAVLRPPHMTSMQPQEHTLLAPLKSPGLPLSPRPSDRPMNAPLPRMPIKPVRSYGSLSPSSQQPTLAQQPPPQVPVPPLSPALSLPNPFGATTKTVVNGPYQPLDTGDEGKRSPMVSQLGTSSQDHRRGDDIRPQHINKANYPSTVATSRILLSPASLSTVAVMVDSCRLAPLEMSRMTAKYNEEEVPFTLAICSRADGRPLWKVQKTLLALHLFDSSLRIMFDFDTLTPDRSLFSGQAPARLDARRDAINDYFRAILIAPLGDERTGLLVCGFLSTDVIASSGGTETDSDSGISAGSMTTLRRREGYLSKKGKSLGGWKARYFVLDSQDLQYFEVPGGEECGSINLRNAQIARQTRSGTSESLEFRHAFMIMELKRQDSSNVNRHILCAETDEERDLWIEALLPYTELMQEDEKPAAVPTSAPGARPPTNRALTDVINGRQGLKMAQELKRLPLLQTISYESTTAAESPLLGVTSSRTSWSPTADDASDAGSQVSSHTSINQQGPPTTQQTQVLRTKSPTAAKKKRSLFGFRSKDDDAIPPSPQLSSGKAGQLPAKQSNRSGRPIFGIPLGEAAECFPPKDIDICLPSPVYRCIEFLEHKQAAEEEGIFRLSGSNTVIKALKERFDKEGDVNLLVGINYDVHAVASLLKLYLRELPESILTRQLHLDFTRIVDDSDDDLQKVRSINALVHRLPEANVELLATLSRFLIDIINHSDVNRMSVRNVGIVFSPTLNVPAQLISLFLTQYGAIFGGIIEDAVASLSVTSPRVPATPVTSVPGIAGQPPAIQSPVPSKDLRSPREPSFPTQPLHHKPRQDLVS